MCKEYNGWPNYETWCVNLWLTNEEATNDQGDILVKEHHIYVDYEALTGIVQGLGPHNDNRQSKANNLRAYVNDLCNQEFGRNSYGMFADLLTASLDNVDWQEIIRVHQEALESEDFTRRRTVGRSIKSLRRSHEVEA
jgi:hypothetical protein